MQDWQVPVEERKYPLTHDRQIDESQVRHWELYVWQFVHDPEVSKNDPDEQSKQAVPSQDKQEGLYNWQVIQLFFCELQTKPDAVSHYVHPEAVQATQLGSNDAHVTHVLLSPLNINPLSQDKQTLASQVRQEEW